MDGRPEGDLALFDALPLMACVGDTGGAVRYVNQRFRRYTGRDRAWVREHGWRALIHPEDVTAADAAWARSITSGEPYEHAYRFRRHDGTYRWHLYRGEAAPEQADGRRTRWVGTWTDVHEIHRADAALARSRRRLEEQFALLDALYRHAPIGLGFLDRDMRLVRANHALLASRQTTAGRTLGRYLRDLVPDLWPELEPILERVVTGRETVDDLEVSLPDADDPARTRWWSLGYYPVELDGEVLGVGTVAQDRTDQVERTRRLQSSEELWLLAERAASLGSWEQDLRTGASRWSPGFYEVLGVDPNLPPGPELFEACIVDEDRPVFHEAVRHLLRTKGTTATLYRLHGPDGSERILEGRGACDVEDGRVTRIFGTTQDVTERERLRHEREALLERSLTAADRERQRIAEHLHDDVVQALTATLLRLDHAQATGSTEPLGRARGTLEVAMRSLRLNIMELSPVDLADGIEAAIAAYAEQLFEVDEIAVTLQVEVVDERLIAPDLLLTTYRIIREALANARWHAKPNEVVVGLRRDGDRLVGEVTDDGVGVHGEPADRPGHLGMRLMRERAELAGGQVTVGPRETGSGTTVSWTLPL